MNGAVLTDRVLRRELMLAGIFRRFLMCTLLLIAAPLQAEWMDWAITARAELEADDNVNIAPSGVELDDESLSLGAGTGRSYMFESSPHSNTHLGWNLDLSRRFYNQFSDLTYTRAGGALRLQHKFGLGMTAPRLSLTGSGHYQRVRDGNRDAAYYANGDPGDQPDGKPAAGCVNRKVAADQIPRIAHAAPPATLAQFWGKRSLRSTRRRSRQIVERAHEVSATRSATRSLAERARGFSRSSASPAGMGRRVMTRSRTFPPQMQTGVRGGHVQPRAASRIRCLTTRSSPEWYERITN